jgi:hypothetical protein
VRTRRYGIVRSDSRGLPDKAAAGKLEARRDPDGPAQPDGTRHGGDSPARRADEKGKIMASYRKTARTLTAGAAVLGALALSGPAQAADRTNVVAYGSSIRAEALSYGANGAVRICDTDADGYGVAVRYYRRTGNLQWLYNTGKGNGQCSETTDIQSNPISLFSACVIIDSIPYCNSTYADTGR